MSTEDRIDPEKIIVAGLVFSQKFHNELGKFRKDLLHDILSTKTAKTVCSWIFEHIDKYNNPPKSEIIDIRDLRKKAANGTDDEDNVELAGKLIDSVIKSFTENENWEHRIDQTFEYIKKRKLENIHSKVELLIDAGDYDGAEELITGFNTVQKQAVAGISLLKNSKEVVCILNEEDEESTIQFPGAIGKLIGPVQKGDLMAFVSPAKRGKSWWLQECAVRAMMNKKVAVYYSLEMSERQMFGRIAQRITVSLKKGSQPRQVLSPYFDDDGDIKTKEVLQKEYTTNSLSRKMKQIKLLAGSGDIHICCFPAYSADVKQLKMHLSQLEKEKGIVPDVIIVDYADILAPGIKQDYRHQIDHTWKMLRALAQERNALVVTASHSSRSTFNKDMTQEDLSEDIRKVNHVSCMVGLNQKNSDKKLGVMRAVSLAQRHDSFNPDDEVVVLYDYSTGRPIIDSRWKFETNYAALTAGKERDDED